MSKSIKPGDLGAAIGQELTLYHEDVIRRTNLVGRRTAKKLLTITKATAPEGKRGKYRNSLKIKHFTNQRGNVRWVWHAGDEYRLTHLLVKGHATKDGGRTKPNPFLHNALAEVLPEYEKALEVELREK